KRLKRRHQGGKYKNLVRIGGVIYYVRTIDGRRVKKSLETSDWDEARAAADAFEAEFDVNKPGFALPQTPTLGEFAKRYLTENTAHLAASTLYSRERLLRADGPLLARLGEKPLHEITAADLRAWVVAEIDGRGLALQTGRHYINALSRIFIYARRLGL